MFEKGRKLTLKEIEKLTSQAVIADDWSKISVAENFTCDNIHNCRFCGENYLGAGITIYNIGVKIEDTIILDGAKIENVGKISCPDASNFALGVKVNAVNENGGRAVPLYKGINAQSAYYLAMYRHKKAEIDKLFELIDQQNKQETKSKNIIGEGCQITSCTSLEGVHLSGETKIEGALSIINCTTQAKAYIGYGVILEEVMTDNGARIENSTCLKRCFVGECVTLSSGFYAIDSLFFANSDLATGECCSVFAGPYTVSHHKSSLLIAGLFSFFNAGSGTNQSNHLFKTGAVHQAIHERGCKYGSNAYIMAPAKTGAYNVVLSRHSSHHDTSDFPFSYLIDNEGKSYLMPGAGLKSFGTERDIKKWAERDKREGEKRDLIHFDKWNPYIGTKLCKALEISNKLEQKKAETYTHNRVKITATMLKRGINLYNLALNATLANIIESGGEIVEFGAGEWLDLAGLYAPKSAIDSLIISTLKQFHEDLKCIFYNYKNYSYTWAMSKISESQKQEIIDKGKQSEMKLAEMTLSDMKSDSATLMQVGYGVDENNKELKELDFLTVRGL